MEPNRILVIQAGKLGDMVCTTPVFRAIKASYPKAHLIVLGDAVNKEVLRGNPHVDEYAVLADFDKERLKELRIDTAVLLTPNPRLLWLLIKHRTRNIIVPKVVGGFSPYATKKYRLLSLLATRIPHRMHHYAPLEYLRMLAPLGIHASDTAKELFVTGEVERASKELLAGAFGHKKIAIAPGAGNRIKEWPPENFAKVASYFAGKGFIIVLIGGLKDEDLGKIVKEDLPTKSVIDTIGRISIEELKAVVKGVDLFISADTGPVYIAEAFGIPTVDIIGPVDEREQPPQGERHAIVFPPEREKPELFVMNARIYSETAQQLARSTRVEDVIEAAERLLHG